MKNYLKIIKKAKKIALFSHESPDPDTIGSTVGLHNALFKIGKSVDLFCESEIPENYHFLNETIKFNAVSFNKENYDLLIAVDIASSHMLGKFENDFVSHGNTMRIDHHLKGDFKTMCNVVETYSACSILVYEIIQKLKVKIDGDIATPLYFAVCGDTGVFRNNNTDAKTFEVSAKLLKQGAEIRRVYSEFFDKKTVPYLKFTSNILLGAEIDEEFKFVIMQASKDDYQKFGVSEEEVIGNLPNTYLNCGYKVAVVLKEKDDGIHCSLRSKFEFDCSKIAEVFGGGGHKNASGCKIENSLSEAKTLMANAIKEYLKNLNKEI